jgi:hypothetical protein
VSAINAHALAGGLVTASVLNGNGSLDIQTPCLPAATRAADAAGAPRRSRHSFGGASVRLVADAAGPAEGITVVVTTSLTGSGRHGRAQTVEFGANTSRPDGAGLSYD